VPVNDRLETAQPLFRTTKSLQITIFCANDERAPVLVCRRLKALQITK
jgi:hypothetical protein